MPKTSKEREEKILRSPNFKKGAFQNLSITPMMAADTNYITVILGLLSEETFELEAFGFAAFNKNRLEIP